MHAVLCACIPCTCKHMLVQRRAHTLQCLPGYSLARRGQMGVSCTRRWTALLRPVHCPVRGHGSAHCPARGHGTPERMRADSFAAFTAGVARHAPLQAPEEAELHEQAVLALSGECASPKPRASLDAPLSEEEVELGMRSLKHRKTAGLDNLLVELL